MQDANKMAILRFNFLKWKQKASLEDWKKGKNLSETPSPTLYDCLKGIIHNEITFTTSDWIGTEDDW